MIIITGAAGFIASNVTSSLNRAGRTDLVLADDFSINSKRPNWENSQYESLVPRDILPQWIEAHHDEIELIIHLGARTDTTEFNWNVFVKLNLEYTKQLWNLSTKYCIPFIYASSAATYGDGSLGYSDSHDIVERLQPLNPYGKSKNEFDKWALAQVRECHMPPFWAGLKFFNVYGPNEYHKGRMASVILHTFESVQNTGHMDLFRSHRPDFQDGMQLRDFVYVKDVANVILFLAQNKPQSGLFNVGTGKAQSFLELANATFDSMGKTRNISFVDIPIDIRDKYQYFTEADISKLKSVGYNKPFHDLCDGIHDYVTNYLSHHLYN